MSDIEKKMYDIRDSLKMPGLGDRLEKIVSETKASAGIDGFRALSEDELDLVAGGKTYMSGEFPTDRAPKEAIDIKTSPRSGLQC